MDYVDRLTALRIDHDLSQKEIGILLNRPQPGISNYELKKSSYHVEDIIRLCEYYQVSADYILGLPEGLPCLRQD